MALPNPNANVEERIGTLTNENLTELVEEQATASSNLTTLVSVTKMLLESQEKLFEKIVNMLDIRAEKTEMKDVAGAVAGEDSLGIAEALKNSMGGFGLGQALMLAFLAWVTGLDQFLRLKLLPRITKELSSVFGRIIRFENFKNLIRDLKPFKDFMNGFRRIITSISKFVMPVVKALRGVGGFLKSFSSIARAARLLRFLFGPFSMALFAIFDFVSGFIKGFQEGGLLEGLKEGALELVRGFITKPLDLLKDIISWAAGKLGFEEFETLLDSFSFTDLFNQLVEWLENFFPKIGDWIVSSWEKMTNAVENGIDSVGEWWTSITTSIGDFFSNIGQWVSDKISAAWTSIKNLFTGGGEGAEGSMPSFDISKLLPSMDFEIPSVAQIKDEVLASVGEKINNTFQWLASQLPDFAGISRFFSDAGISLAESLGAQNLSKYNADTGEIESPIQPTTITETGAAVGAGSQQVFNMREYRPAGGSAIIAPNNSSTNIQTNNVSSTNYSPAPPARPRSPAMGMYAG